jgi:hypothetical protein
MIGKPREAPAPIDAKVWRRSWMRRPARPAALVTAAHGFFKSARHAPVRPPGMMYGLPSSRGRAASTACAAADR